MEVLATLFYVVVTSVVTFILGILATLSTINICKTIGYKFKYFDPMFVGIGLSIIASIVSGLVMLVYKL